MLGALPPLTNFGSGTSASTSTAPATPERRRRLGAKQRDWTGAASGLTPARILWSCGSQNLAPSISACQVGAMKRRPVEAG